MTLERIGEIVPEFLALAVWLYAKETDKRVQFVDIVLHRRLEIRSVVNGMMFGWNMTYAGHTEPIDSL